MTENDRSAWQATVRAKMEAAQREHALKVGEVAISWVRFHMYFRLWFSVLTAQGKDHAPAMREWDRVGSDSQQRNQFLRPALDANRARSPQAIDAMLWVCDWADQLAKIRNTFVHVAAFFRQVDGEIQVQFDEQLHLTDAEDRYRFVKKNPDESYTAVMADLDSLSEFMHRTLIALSLPDKFGPFPERPAIKVAEMFPDLRNNITH